MKCFLSSTNKRLSAEINFCITGSRKGKLSKSISDLCRYLGVVLSLVLVDAVIPKYKRIDVFALDPTKKHPTKKTVRFVKE